MSKKLFFYSLDPNYFKDFNNDGFGDFLGVSTKVDYLKWISVDYVILKNIFVPFSKDNLFLNKIKNSLGPEKELAFLGKVLNENEMKLIVEFSFNNTNFKHAWLNPNIKFVDDEEFVYNGDQFFFIKSFKNLEDKNNFLFKTLVNKMVLLFNKLKRLNINGIVLKYFDIFSKLTKENCFNKEQIFIFLKKLYLKTKQEIADFEIILDFKNIDLKEVLKNNEVFYDFIINSKFIQNIYMNNYHKNKYLIKIGENINSNKVILSSSRRILESKKIQNNFKKNPDNFTKTLILLFLLHKYNLNINSGDEFGYYDLKNLEYEKFFMWDDSVSGGFSKRDVYFKESFRRNNLEKQVLDSDSTLSFFKKIISLIKSNFLQNKWNNKEIKLKIDRNKILIKSKNNFLILINLSSKKRTIKNRIIFKKFTLQYSSYQKDISSNFNYKLMPYESLLFSFDKKISRNIN